MYNEFMQRKCVCWKSIPLSTTDNLKVFEWHLKILSNNGCLLSICCWTYVGTNHRWLLVILVWISSLGRSLSLKWKLQYLRELCYDNLVWKNFLLLVMNDGHSKVHIQSRIFHHKKDSKIRLNSIASFKPSSWEMMCFSFCVCSSSCVQQLLKVHG